MDRSAAAGECIAVKRARRDQRVSPFSSTQRHRRDAL